MCVCVCVCVCVCAHACVVCVCMCVCEPDKFCCEGCLSSCRVYHRHQAEKYEFEGEKGKIEENEYVASGDVIVKNEAYMAREEAEVQSITLKFVEYASDDEETKL